MAETDDTGARAVDKMSFEEAMAELEAIVGKLEAGTVDLDDSIALYQRGDALKKHCQNKLDDAQAKIEKIKSADGETAQSTEPFDA